MRQDFTDQELKNLECGDKLFWSWKPIAGRLGGMLLGIRDSTLEVGLVDQGQFFQSATIYHRGAKFKFEFICVYGPADHARSVDFLGEIEHKISHCPYLVVVGGDFNLISGSRDKNNANINWPRLNLFNDCIAWLGLHEINKSRARFTWTNRQRNHVTSVLDRFLVSQAWVKFLLASLRMKCSIGSDHTPLAPDIGEALFKRSPRLFL